MVRVALFIIFISVYSLQQTSAVTYYNVNNANPSLLSSWGTNVGGTGTNPSNFTTTGDLFIISAATVVGFANNAVVSWTIGTGVTLQVDGEIIYRNNGTKTITINGTIILTSGTANQIDPGNPNGTKTFTLSSGATLITANSAGIAGGGTQSISSGNFDNLNLNTAANYTFNGSLAQSSTGLPATVNNLTIHNTSTTGVTLAGNVTVNGVLDLTDGLLIGSTVTVSSSTVASVINYSNASYVTGTLVRNVISGSTYDFPVGTLTNYELATIANSLTGTSAISVNFIAVDPGTPLTGVVIDLTQINDFLNYGYWNITPNTTPTGGTFNLTLTSTGHTNAAAFLDYHGILRSDTATPFWFQPAVHVVPPHTALTPTSPVTVSATGITTFTSNNFAIGLNTTTILPVVLIQFQVTSTGNVHMLTWTTASELNNDYFIIERSADAIVFSEIGRVKGAGNSEQNLHYSFYDESPLHGINYYRLQQVDFNGNVEYSKLIFIESIVKEKLLLYPNPAMNEVYVEIPENIAGKYTILLLDQNGKLIYTSVKSDQYLHRIAIENLPEGYYAIVLSSNSKQYFTSFLKQ